MYLAASDGKTAQYGLGNRPDSTWEGFSVRLNQETGWVLGGGATTLAEVLANISVFEIRAEYGEGLDSSDLDAVRLVVD